MQKGDKILLGAQKLRKLPHDMCGLSSETVFEKRIVNGDPAELGTYPWMAALGFTRGSARFPAWACGGSLISDQYVLTAAHCLDPTLTYGFKLSVVRLGDLDLNSTNDNAYPIDVGVEKTIIHPGFNNSIKTNDIGLVKLDRKVEFTDLLKPICTPSPEFKTNMFVNSPSVVAGWGVDKNETASTRLLEAELQVTDLAECRRNLTSVFPQVLIDQRVVCAYAPGKDSCQVLSINGGTLILSNYASLGGQHSWRDIYTSEQTTQTHTLLYITNLGHRIPIISEVPFPFYQPLSIPQGDSGGPLMVFRRYRGVSRMYAFGVVSYGNDCAKKGFPGVYTRVSEFMPWIIENMDL
ncbi:serine-type endopeptidase activity protein [Homalodisca vitripennis]|nr:serine-type endopeptidase activity protein [Homalodisca vitripennis]